MILTGTAWGIIMDRFGRKPAVFLGALHPVFTWAGFFFMTPTNYPYIIIGTALVSGLLAPGFWDGSAQLMLTLAPEKNRNAYLSWYMALVGIIAAGGSWLGGRLCDALAGVHYELWTGFTIGSFHLVAAVSFVLSVVSVLMLLKIREGSEKPVGYVVSRLFTPGIFRTFMSMGTITSAASSSETVRALRAIDGVSGHLAVTDIQGRLRDPNPEVREEAARALGRIGSVDAVEMLIQRLRDPHSTIRPECALALGQIGDRRAMAALTEGLACPMPEVQEACQRSLEMIGKPRRSVALVRELRNLDGPAALGKIAEVVGYLDDPDPEVGEEAARALGRIGMTEAVEALVKRLRDPDSGLRCQAAQALGQIGDPRAVPALIDGLSDVSVELQDACAQALGDIGGREALRHLRKFLDGKHPERVLVSSAEAVSKHGILEAAWEILPRMHATTNTVLRSQLAIAMGNLLGRPGQFYQVLTSETARQGSRLGKLCRGTKRAVRSLGPSMPAGMDRARVFDELDEEFDRVRGLMEGQSYRPAIEALYQIARRMTGIAIARECPDEVAFDYAFTRDAKLGLGFWFICEVKLQAARISDQNLLHIDALLALYFLSVYRLPPERPNGKVVAKPR